MKKAKQEIKVVQFPPGEIEPLFIRASDVGRVIIGLSPKTLSNHRSLGIGVEYHVVAGSVFYEFKVLKEYFSTGRVETLNREDL